MNYNFVDTVRKALVAAREESVRWRHEYVGTEHILLGLLSDEGTVANLRKLRVTPEEIREKLAEVLPPGQSTVTRGELPYTSRAKKVLEFSMSEARERGDDFVGPEHLFMGELREEHGIAAQVLSQFGVTPENYWAVVAEQRGAGPANLFEFRIDDSSDRSIYEQIVAQVTEAVATGGLQPGERLPTVRQLADELDIAPGTVARAYSELERKGVVVTEGARGTRVAKRDGAPSGLRQDTLAGLLRPVAVAAFHFGATAAELREALEEAMRGIFDKPERAN